MRILAIIFISFSLLLSTKPNIAVAVSSNSDIIEERLLKGSTLGEQSDDVTPFNETNLTWDIIKVFLALAVVIVLMMLLLKWLAKRNRVWSNQRGIKSLGGISLGQNSSVQVIELADRIYIIGVADQVTLLDKEENPEKVAKLIASMSMDDSNSLSSMKQLFNTISNKKNNESTNRNDMWNESTSFEDLLQTKLDKQAERKQEIESLLNDNKR